MWPRDGEVHLRNRIRRRLQTIGNGLGGLREVCLYFSQESAT
jgi:hypothetical protein